jgi:hypothetical protein
MAIAGTGGEYTVATSMTSPGPCKVHEYVPWYIVFCFPERRIGIPYPFGLLAIRCREPLYCTVRDNHRVTCFRSDKSSV